MLPIFTKPLEALTRADLDELVREQYPEGSNVEFKRELPAKAGEPDPWMSGGRKISNYARDKLLEEVVAFANSHGGHLLIGIDEADTKPASAISIMPLPNAADLAERLRLQARDCIEPKISLFHSTAIKTDDAGNGVVVVRVPASRSAPHRHRDLNCYTRRSDRTEKMTMREIQDLTLNLERGIGALRSAFDERANIYASAFKSFDNVDYKSIGFRATALPLSEIYLPGVYRHEAGFEAPRVQTISIDGVQEKLWLPDTPVSERPQLRGTRKLYEDEESYHAIEVFESGLVEQSYFMKKDYNDSYSDKIHVGWLLGLVLSVLKNVERVRKFAGAPDVEYGMEVEMSGSPTSARLMWFKSDYNRELGPLPKPSFQLPQYSVGDSSEFASILTLVLKDCVASVGAHEPLEELRLVEPQDH
ncbi:helix-turn-helix domain-containing protein [Pelagibius sp.]|uniref:AlbA family DNA-binding domain-containing protein n=1 Tax=Pelagibius sp. TaxID=1931238 RepID=UPI003BB0BFE4